MRSWLALARAWRIPVVVGLSSVVAVLVTVLAAQRVPLPGFDAAVVLVQFAPFAACAAVGVMWLSPYGDLERAGCRRPATLRGCRVVISCGLGLVVGGVAARNPAAPRDLFFLTAVCLAVGLASACVAPAYWWALPLCLNYFFYAARLTVGQHTASTPAALIVLALTGLVFAMLRGPRDASAEP